MQLTKVILLASLIGTGCMRGDKSDNTDSAESAVDSEDSVSAEGDVLAANMDGAQTSSLTGADIAVAVAANINAKWPNACAQVTANGANLVVTYNDCSGPRGLVHVTGTLNLALDVSPQGAIDVHATASGFEVNNAVLDIDATAVYAISGTQRSLTVQSKGTGIGPLGNDIDHSGNYTLTWDPSTTCGSINGHWQTDFSNATASAERSNDVNLSKCVSACPTGSLTHHYLGGASLTVTFDGSATAAWSTSLGGSGTVALACR
ncbi:MAG: hypothetical protein QM831_10950 [Kofleriaceae bacterium]